MIPSSRVSPNASTRSAECRSLGQLPVWRSTTLIAADQKLLQKSVLPSGNSTADDGYHGPAASTPRKYVKGPLANGYAHGLVATSGHQEYLARCKTIGAQPNSKVRSMLLDPFGLPRGPHECLGGMWISLRDTYVGERGFIALLPVLDSNTSWTSLDASNNGLRNEAVLHLVDLLMQPQHRDRSIELDLSCNPISDGGGRALLDLINAHPHVAHVDIRRTKVPRTTALTIRKVLQVRREQLQEVCPNCGVVFLADSMFCRRCGKKRPNPGLLESTRTSAMQFEEEKGKEEEEEELPAQDAKASPVAAEEALVNEGQGDGEATGEAGTDLKSMPSSATLEAAPEEDADTAADTGA